MCVVDYCFVRRLCRHDQFQRFLKFWVFRKLKLSGDGVAVTVKVPRGVG